MIAACSLCAFQSTPPRGGRPALPRPLSRCWRFNPRPHAGGDRLRQRQFRPQRVSIHAPTRGATQTIHSFGLFRWCFNPRPHAGGDLTPERRPRVGLVSIHAPTRGATTTGNLTVAADAVSIHAPTRGATLHSDHRHCSSRFNPRPHAGGDAGVHRAVGEQRVSIHAPTRGATSYFIAFLLSKTFQSTPPRGGRPRLVPLST